MAALFALVVAALATVGAFAGALSSERRDLSMRVERRDASVRQFRWIRRPIGLLAIEGNGLEAQERLSLVLRPLVPDRRPAASRLLYDSQVDEVPPDSEERAVALEQDELLRSYEQAASYSFAQRVERSLFRDREHVGIWRLLIASAIQRTGSECLVRLTRVLRMAQDRAVGGGPHERAPLQVITPVVFAAAEQCVATLDRDEASRAAMELESVVAEQPPFGRAMAFVEADSAARSLRSADEVRWLRFDSLRRVVGHTGEARMHAESAECFFACDELQCNCSSDADYERRVIEAEAAQREHVELLWIALSVRGGGYDSCRAIESGPLARAEYLRAPCGAPVRCQETESVLRIDSGCRSVGIVVPRFSGQ